MKRTLLVAVAALAFASPPPAAAQGPELTQRGCGVLADMALVARSLAAEKIAEAQALRIMARVYAGVEGGEPIARLRERVTRAAYAGHDGGAAQETPLDFARRIGEACLRSGGNSDAVLGTSVRWRPAPRGLRV